MELGVHWELISSMGFMFYRIIINLQSSIIVYLQNSKDGYGPRELWWESYQDRWRTLSSAKPKLAFFVSPTFTPATTRPCLTVLPTTLWIRITRRTRAQTLALRLLRKRRWRLPPILPQNLELTGKHWTFRNHCWNLSAPLFRKMP